MWAVRSIIYRQAVVEKQILFSTPFGFDLSCTEIMMALRKKLGV